MRPYVPADASRREVVVRDVEESLEAIHPTLDSTDAWQEQVRVTMLAVLDTVAQNPVVIEGLVEHRRAVLPAVLAKRAELMDRIVGMPLTRDEAEALFDVLGEFVVGAVAVERWSPATRQGASHHRVSTALTAMLRSWPERWVR